MALETGTYISDLNAANPVGGTDLVSTLDDHIRLVKSTIKNTFPSVAGAVSATDVELSYVHGVTSAVQPQINAKAPLASPTFTGNPQAPTPATADSSTSIATTAQVHAVVAAASMSATTPVVPANANQVWTNDGTTPAWGSLLKASVIRLSDGTDATKLLAFSLSGLTTATTRTITVPDKNGTLAMTSDIPSLFTSAEQTITTAGALTIAHGLGVIPRLVLGYLKCVTAEYGYSIGDVLCVSLGFATSNGQNVVVVPDATNLNIRFGSFSSCFVILNKSTGASQNATNANWTFSLRAYP